MARHSIEVIQLLRSTADNIQRSDQYQWGHMGACNCGFLAQQVTHLSKSHIHGRAMAGHGDWNEQLNDYCPTSGLPFDHIISELLNAGFDVDDLKHLERLSDSRILLYVGRDLQKNRKEDVVTYLHAWARMIEEELIEEVNVDLSDEEILLKSY